jgi:predicted metal-dependent phosphoesterase TrpH
LGYNRSDNIDLHIHSTASDGTLSPSQILALAVERNLSAIAITDHDTTRGCVEALAAGIPTGLAFVTGVEISTAAPAAAMGSTGSMHILGYGIRPDSDGLNRELETSRIAREERNPKIIERLCELGVSITLEDVLQVAGDAQTSRPHIARAMVRKGIVKNVDEAFHRYLGHGKPAYVDKYRVPCNRAIRSIRDAGGIAVLAHPYLLKSNSHADIEKIVSELVPMGLGGIETYYPQHSNQETVYYEKLAKRMGLIVTGGSDFHGDLSAGVQMGTGRGHFSVPYRVYQQLMERLISLNYQ